MVGQASAVSGVHFSDAIDDIDGVFPKEAEINFYRIVQECVNNIVKHSQAAHATIRIQRSLGRVTLTVHDDGRGFALELVRGDSSGGFGLIGIAERARLLGGRSSIQSRVGQGTTVTIEIDSRTA
jgi:signal transduction histidine kinase